MEKKTLKFKYVDAPYFVNIYADMFQYGISPRGDYVEVYMDEEILKPFTSETITISEGGEQVKTQTQDEEFDFYRLRHGGMKMTVGAARALCDGLKRCCDAIDNANAGKM